MAEAAENRLMVLRTTHVGNSKVILKNAHIQAHFAKSANVKTMRTRRIMRKSG